MKHTVFRLLIGLLLMLLGVGGAAAQSSYDKFALWDSGQTTLRGANIFQRFVSPNDGADFLGGGHIGPPYTQADFDQLASLGANMVVLSTPGLYTISPPYVLDTQAQDNLDDLLTKAENANLFAVISFRTGPGRSDYTFYRDGAGVWYPADYLIETVWTSQAAQDAWVAMWHYTAQRYRTHHAVIGYDLMVEPNSIVLLNQYDPQQFFADYGGTLYDWNQLEPRLIATIRQVDTDTPLLLSSNGWNGMLWQAYHYISADPRVVYTVHNYDPFVYSNQDSGANITYPGTFDGNYDNVPDTINKAWLEANYVNTVDVFRAAHNNPPMAVLELGVARFAPGAATYISDHISVVESRGLHHALWMYHGGWVPFRTYDNTFDFLMGSDPNQNPIGDVLNNPLLLAIQQKWAQNTVHLADFPLVNLTQSPRRNAVTGTPVTLTWSHISGALGYRVQVADSASFAHLIVDDNTLPPDALSTDVTLPAAGTYYWRVSARTGSATWGNWSAVDTFTLLPS